MNDTVPIELEFNLAARFLEVLNRGLVEGKDLPSATAIAADRIMRDAYAQGKQDGRDEA